MNKTLVRLIAVAGAAEAAEWFIELLTGRPNVIKKLLRDTVTAPAGCLRQIRKIRGFLKSAKKRLTLRFNSKRVRYAFKSRKLSVESESAKTAFAVFHSRQFGHSAKYSA